MNTYSGAITTITGPMFGGKTSRLLLEMEKNEMGRKRAILIKNPMDGRYGDRGCVYTHNGTKKEAYVSESSTRLFECGMSPDQIAREYDVVCIDEGQFYEDTDIFCETLANRGIKVYCSTLLGDFKRQIFPVIARLLAFSDDIIFTKAVDIVSGDDAPFTKLKYISNETDKDFVVGGSEMYEPVSRESFFRPNSQTRKDDLHVTFKEDHPLALDVHLIP